MSFEQLNRGSILAAIDEYRDTYRGDFLSTHSVAVDGKYWIVSNGDHLPLVPLMVAAYHHQFPEQGVPDAEPEHLAAIARRAEMNVGEVEDELADELRHAWNFRSPSGKIDRDSEQVARDLLRSWFSSDSYREQAEEIILQITEVAAAAGAESWSYSLFPNRLRLIVGKGVAVSCGDDMICLAVSTSSAPIRELVASLGPKVLSREDDHAWVFLLKGDRALWEQLKQASADHAKRLVQARSITFWPQAHAPGLARYLEEEYDVRLDDTSQLVRRAERLRKGRGKMGSFLKFVEDLDTSKYQEHNRLAERERAEIIRRFPEEDWSEMRLRDYALGHPEYDDTYSTYIEFRSPHLGSVKGGSSVKHGVYYSKSKQAWQYHDSYESVEDAWEELRQGFLDLFRLAEEEKWAEIDDTSPIASSIRLKTLVMYRPGKVLPIGSKRHLKFFLENLGLKHSEVTGLDVLVLNTTLLDLLRQQPELEPLSNRELMEALYEWRDPRETKRFIKVAPGEGAKLWEQCLDNGCILVGWEAVGDMNEFESKQELRVVVEREYGREYNDQQAMISRVTNDLWEYRSLEPGDTIVANKGTREVLAVGEVQAPGYQYRPEFGDHPHFVPVEWDESFAKPIPNQPDWQNTIRRKIPVSLQLRILERDGPGPGPSPGKVSPLPPPAPIYDTVSESLRHKKQVVLYGPPGTGKTYLARRFALWWIDQETPDLLRALSDEEEFSSFESQIESTRKERQTWLVVANPRKAEFEWDDLKERNVEFTEGNVKRNFPLVEVGDLVFGYEAGTSKCIKAVGRVSERFRETSEGRSFQVEHVYDISEGPTFKELRADELLATAQGISSGCRGTLFRLNDEEAEAMLELIEERDPKIREAVQEERQLSQITRVTFHPSYAYEDFVEGFRPENTPDGSLRLSLQDGVFKHVCREAAVAPDKKFLLLIDELNRGNVAKIFGELITLLESDKRGMVVRLPQSKQSFAVPPNVYILATMNTADRSLRHLDAALRRRFQFIEMLPDTDLLAGYQVRDLALDDFLFQLNARIVKTFGREKQIGHSFLMRDGAPIIDEEEFAFRFRYELLPLVQEYCYDDFGQLARFFGDQIINRDLERFEDDVLSDPALLLDALEAHFGVVQRTAAE